MNAARKIWPGCAIVLALSLALAGCSESKPAEQPAKPEPTPQAVPRPVDAPPNPAQTPTKPAEPAKPEVVPQRPKQEPSPSPAAEPPTIVPEGKKPAPKEEPKPAPPAPPTPPAAPQKPAPEPTKAVAGDVVVLTGSPMGAVRLEHKLHTQRAGNTCTTCHHASKPEKPATAPQQACSNCHTKVAAPPMKTKLQAAFHNPTAQSGTCIDCHKTEAAKGKKAPLKCTECHRKENK